MRLDAPARGSPGYALCRHLPAADRPAVLAEALRTMRALEAPFDRAYGLCDIIDHLEPEDRPAVLGEVLAAVRAIEGDAQRVGPLCTIGEHLPPDAAPWRARILDVAPPSRTQRSVSRDLSGV